jgi:hypothetical protein
MLASGVGFGIAVGVAVGGVFRAGVAAGVAAGLAAGLAGGFSFITSQAAWPSYLLTMGWLAFRHRLPWSLMGFLADAHRRGVLRQAGAVYQFRHIELQHRLANRDADEQQANSAPSGGGSVAPSSAPALTVPQTAQRRVHPPRKPPENAGLPAFALRRRPSSAHRRIASGSAPASRHYCATRRSSNSLSSPR